MKLQRSLAVVLSAMVLGGYAHAQESGIMSSGTFEPVVGQAGKDVVWVPTPQALVDRMLDMARLTPQDRLVDLGSGDGRTVITAAQRGANARGIEYNPEMVAISVKAAQAAGVSNRAKFEQGDIFEKDFSEADVLTLFLLPSLNVRLRPTILDMKPGTRVVSNSFSMGDWEPDQTVNVTENCTGYCKALLWIVPAKVEGTWKMPGKELELKQKFQVLEGTMRENGQTVPISNARLNGAEIEFSVGDQRYVGKVNGDTMGGMINGSTVWAALR